MTATCHFDIWREGVQWLLNYCPPEPPAQSHPCRYEHPSKDAKTITWKVLSVMPVMEWMTVDQIIKESSQPEDVVRKVLQRMAGLGWVVTDEGTPRKYLRSI